MMKDKIQSLYTSNSYKNINLTFTQTYPIRDHDLVSQATCIMEVAGGHPPCLTCGTRQWSVNPPNHQAKTDALTERPQLTTTPRPVATVEQACRPTSPPALQS